MSMRNIPEKQKQAASEVNSMSLQNSPVWVWEIFLRSRSKQRVKWTACHYRTVERTLLKCCPRWWSTGYESEINIDNDVIVANLRSKYDLNWKIVSFVFLEFWIFWNRNNMQYKSIQVGPEKSLKFQHNLQMEKSTFGRRVVGCSMS